MTRGAFRFLEMVGGGGNKQKKLFIFCIISGFDFVFIHRSLSFLTVQGELDSEETHPKRSCKVRESALNKCHPFLFLVFFFFVYF